MGNGFTITSKKMIKNEYRYLNAKVLTNFAYRHRLKH